MNRDLESYRAIILDILRRKELPDLDDALKALPEVGVRAGFQFLNDISRMVDALEVIGDALRTIEKDLHDIRALQGR